MIESKGTAGPVGERERIAELDVLRGIALFGVLTMNFSSGACCSRISLEYPFWSISRRCARRWPAVAVTWSGCNHWFPSIS